MSSQEYPELTSSEPQEGSVRSREPIMSIEQTHKAPSPVKQRTSSPLAQVADKQYGHGQNRVATPSPDLPVIQSKSLSPPRSRNTPSHSPPRPRSAEAEIPIDPTLLEAEGKPDDINNFGHHSKSPNVADSSVANEAIPKEVLGTDQAPHLTRSDSYMLNHNGLAPWNLSTSNLQVESQPPTSTSSSPDTPGLGIGGLYHGRPFDLSRQSSMTDLGTYLGATKGMSTGSEDGYEEHMDMEGDHGASDSAGGIPPPRQKKSHARKQPPGHIKRARNAFILFRKHVTDSNLIPPSVEVKHQNISVVAAKMWREAPQEVRQKFQEQARIEKEEHQRKYPGYRYQPVFRRTDIIRRRVRKDSAEDEKVEAVAEALIKGKAGNDLEHEIREQMVARSEASESDAEGSRQPASGGSRRRRRETGQLSKGAIRAQRAQARAKQMRQNLLGSNLLNMSLYNAAAQRGQIPNHPGAQHHLQYPMAESYLPVGYDMEGRPIQYDTQMYAGDFAGNEMYRLPPIDGMGMGYDNWTGGQGIDYWTGTGEYENHHPALETYYPPSMTGAEYTRDASDGLDLGQSGIHNDYQLAPMMDTQAQLPPVDFGVHATVQKNDEPEKDGMDARMREWARDGQQTPSGHVMFNERLFDGELGSAGLPALLDGVGRDDGLLGFDEAMAQANESTQW